MPKRRKGQACPYQPTPAAGSGQEPRPGPEAGSAAERQAQLARLSHDLRQPLQALQINTAAMSLRARRLGDDALLRLADAVDSSLQHSQQLLDSLLPLLLLQQTGAAVAAPRTEALALWPLLISLQQEHAELAARRGLSLSLGDEPATPLWVHSDAALLRRLLGNLLSNALKFCAQGGVMLMAGPVSEGRLTLQVIDTGVGMAAEQQARVFEPGYQVVPGQGRDAGQGLGLAIVRELAAALDIGLALRSAPGQGSCFSLSLPAAAAAAG